MNKGVDRGLGSPLNTLSSSTYASYQAAGYASQLIYIVTIALAKASTLTLLVAITPQKTHRMPMFCVSGLVAAWAFASLWAAAFQCSLPKPYLFTSSPIGVGPSAAPHAKCFNQVAFWDAVGAFDILTDLAIMALPILVVRDLQLNFRKKINVVVAFSFRLIAVGMCIFRLVTIPAMLKRGTDVTMNAWIPTIATMLEVFFSIFAACVPHLRPFMESIQAGYLSGVTDDNTHAGSRAGYGRDTGDNYIMSKIGQQSRAEKNQMRSQVQSGKASIDLPRHGQRGGDLEGRPGIGQALSTNEVVGRGMVEKPQQAHVRNESVGSEGGRSGESTGSKAMIIKTTKEWSVSYQE